MSEPEGVGPSRLSVCLTGVGNVERKSEESQKRLSESDERVEGRRKGEWVGD